MTEDRCALREDSGRFRAQGEGRSSDAESSPEATSEEAPRNPYKFADPIARCKEHEGPRPELEDPSLRGKPRDRRGRRNRQGSTSAGLEQSTAREIEGSGHATSDPDFNRLGLNKTQPDVFKPEATSQQMLAGRRSPSPQPRPRMILQLETRAVSEEQLIDELRGIYAGLVLVEKKCVEIDQQQSQTSDKLSDEKWQALAALHQTFLNESYDFLLASQHPSAGPAVRKLPKKYAIPARMWHHGLHSFLELLRYRLPDSYDHMVAFIYAAYSTEALLMETVPIFEEIWMESLGDLARYRMAIETDVHEKKAWCGLARYWYNKIADKRPTLGRVQHHIAVLARPNILQQLFFYCKSMTCAKPFSGTRQSIMLLFNPILNPEESTYQNLDKYVMSFASLHATAFSQGLIVTFIKFGNEFASNLESQIFGVIGSQWKENGAYIALVNISSMLEYGNSEGILMKNLSPSVRDHSWMKPEKAREYWTPVTCYSAERLSKLSSRAPSDTSRFSVSLDILSYTAYFTFSTLSSVLKHVNNDNVLPHVHVSLAFLWCLALIPECMMYIQAEIPWSELVFFLNRLNRQNVDESRLTSDNFPHPSGTTNPLPEDHSIRGQIWNQYHPADFFDNTSVDEECPQEFASTNASRTERCLWLGCRLASLSCWITYDKANFAVTPFAIKLKKAARGSTVFNSMSTTSFLGRK